MTSVRRIAGLVAASLVLSLAPAAHAEPTAVERETARTLLLAGRDKKKAGNLKGALSDFQKAHRIMGVPTTALDLGKAQKDLGLLVEARTSFLEAVQYPEKSKDPEPFKRARREAKLLADEIAPRLGTLTIRTSSGATVTMDDTELAPSSLGVPLKVNPGRHEIVATLNGEEQRKTVDVEEGGKPPPVHLVFAETTAQAPKVEPKDDKPEVSKSSKTGSDEVETTKTSPLVYAGAAAAAVGVGVGAVTGILAFKAKSDVSARCEGGTQCPAATWPDIDKGEQLATVSTIAFVVGGVGAVVLIYGLLNPTKAPVTIETAAGKLTVFPGPNGVSGTF